MKGEGRSPSTFSLAPSPCPFFFTLSPFPLPPSPLPPLHSPVFPSPSPFPLDSEFLLKLLTILRKGGRGVGPGTCSEQEVSVSSILHHFTKFRMRFAHSRCASRILDALRAFWMRFAHLTRLADARLNGPRFARPTKLASQAPSLNLSGETKGGGGGGSGTLADSLKF